MTSQASLVKSMIFNQPEDIQELYQVALKAREHSYSPYSSYKVGTAIRTSDGKVFSGCNVENASFGATICAERVAIQKAVSEIGKFSLSEILVVTKANPPWPPCGMCRQVIAEFAQNDVTVYMTNVEGVFLKIAFSKLFPEAFTPFNLL